MLCLKRKETETVTFGKAGDVLTGPIVVKVGELRPTSVKLEIDCQRDIRIERTGNVADCRDDRKPTNRRESD